MRTAILNWLFARNQGGAFVLRMEDTDVVRNVEGGEQAALDALDWLGLDRDEGPAVGGDYGPYRSSERADHYHRHAQDLLAAGHAFRCFCTPEQMEDDRTAAIAAGEPPGRDRRCRELTTEQADALQASLGDQVPSLRLRVDSGPVEFTDRLKGTLSIDGDDLGDMVIMRPDGRPTYNFAVTVDDLAMRITHVIRGIGHLSNTPKQVLLYHAFDAEPPEFIHIPQVLAEGGGKLSKRKGAPGILEYRDQGYPADAILNYLSLLAWSSTSGEEVLSRADLIEQISLDRLGAADAEVDSEKLRWLAGQHLRRLPPGELADRWARLPDVAALGLDAADLVRAAEVFAERTHLFNEAAGELEPVFAEPTLDTDDARDALSTDSAIAAIQTLADSWADVEWRPEPLKSAMRDGMKAAGLGGKGFFHPTRVALMGTTHGPDQANVAYALGPDRTAARLAAGLARARELDSRKEDADG